MVALADRYIFSLIARAVIRGVSPEWMEDLYGFALIPDAVIYLDIDVEHLLPRVIGSTGFDYWESGQDFLPSTSVYDTFVEYQTWLLDEFRRLAARHDFHVVDARGSVPEIFRAISKQVEEVVAGMEKESFTDELPEEPSGEAASATLPHLE
jgi:dTMP kinase